MAKVQISIPDDLLKRVDLFCDRNFQNRSSLFSQSVLQFMNQFEMVSSMVSLSASMRKIADIGTIDDETKKELQALEQFAQSLNDLSK